LAGADEATFLPQEAQAAAEPPGGAAPGAFVARQAAQEARVEARNALTGFQGPIPKPASSPHVDEARKALARQLGLEDSKGIEFIDKTVEEDKGIVTLKYEGRIYFLGFSDAGNVGTPALRWARRAVRGVRGLWAQVTR
jgi:hypothetical protein